jgi:tetraacyldisaccharide 4'-kinase
MNKFSWVSGLVLRVLSGVYDGITSARNFLYDTGVLAAYTSVIPIVSVGNVTVGGNGKTPLCLYLVDQLLSRGFKPVILSRGYGGRRKGPHRILDNDSAADVGDEPLLMARKSGIPVYIARSRSSGARLIENDKAGDVIVLDDGFQHRRLERDVNIVSIFAGTERAVEEFSRGHLLPYGRFREDRERALARADLAVVSYRKVFPSEGDVPPIDERILKAVPRNITVFRAFYKSLGVFTLIDDAPLGVRSVRALSGIANPEGFYESLMAQGFTITGRHAYPDHYSFSEDEMLALIATYPGELFVCTEKDAIKLSAMGEKVRAAFAQLKVSLSVMPSDAFMVSILRMIRRRGEEAATEL